MTILDTFYILFKTNADDVKRGLDIVNKVAKDTEKSLKETNEQADTLGKTFVKMVEGGAELAGMVSAFNLVKAGVVNQRDYNAQLYTTSTLYKQNAGALKEFAQAAAQLGGSRESAMSDMMGYAQTAQQRGLKYDPLAQMQAARARYQSLSNSPVAQAQMLTGANAYYQDPGLQMMLQMNNKDFNATLNSTGVQAAGSLTNEQAKTAFDSKFAQEDLKGSVGKLDTTIGTGLIPSINKLTNIMSDVASTMGDHLITALYAVAGLIAGKGLLAGGIGRSVAASVLRGGLSAAAAEGGISAGAVAGAGAAGIGALGAGAATVGVGAASLYGGYKLGGYLVGQSPLERWATEYMTRDIYKGGKPKGSLSGGDDMGYWMQQGYSKEQAAGIVANMQRESKGNPNAIGDNGNAKGLFQWRKGRRDAILNGTGIDVWNSSKADQMKAAAWEMKNGSTGFNDKIFRGIGAADQAGGYFSSHFERPANGYGEALLRGQNAMSLASGYRAPVTVGTANVTIGAITINAPGADAKQVAQHVKAELRSSLATIQAQADNGRAG